MSIPSKDKPLIYALVPLAVIFGAALVAVGWRGSRASAILRTAPRKIVIPQPAGALTLTDDLQIIQDRALFYATRKFYDPVFATPATTQSQLSSYQLMGTLLIPQRPRLAFLRKSPRDNTTAVSPGDHLDGWTVEAVQSGKAVFAYGDQRVTLTTILPFESGPTSQGVVVVRMHITEPPQHHSSAEHVP